jgi:DNA-binding GntR family transcriptional regulator
MRKAIVCIVAQFLAANNETFEISITTHPADRFTLSMLI